jgi:hypothetical protein
VREDGEREIALGEALFPLSGAEAECDYVGKSHISACLQHAKAFYAKKSRIRILITRNHDDRNSISGACSCAGLIMHAMKAKR